MMTYSELSALPNGGITDVVDLSWSRRDRGHEWLVVERGLSSGGGYSSTAKLVATSATERGARIRAGKAKASLRRQRCLGVIDVIRRDAVTMRTSGTPYGCFSGEGGA